MNTEPSFGTIAKNRRRELGLTQDELARRVGCAPITIRKIEADDLRPSVQIAERMAMALNIHLEERAAFVKLARQVPTPAEEPRLTPMPTLEEIGNEDLTGRAIRGYALGERLGSGGMGVVYRAVQPFVEREVAIKIILPKYANHPDFIRRFEAEAQLVARLEHPHIVPLYDYWREPGVAYLVMRLLRGGSVQSLLHEGTVLPSGTVLSIMEQIGSALRAAHRAGVVHRDLKPANVLLDDDQNAYLADFGIAKNLSNFSNETQTDVIMGSPDYISPEQIRSELIRPQTDIYTLGVMLYELLTGRVPFQGPTPFDVMAQHLGAPLPPLSAGRAGVPGSLDQIIRHATAKDPLQRYESVDTFLDELRGALGENPSSGKKQTHSQIDGRPLRENDNPYKGLRAFGEGDAQDFFGREALLQQLLIRLGEGDELSRFLTVVGPSGSGKSSVVKAGLIPALRRGALPGSENWFIVEMMPGSHPLEELEAALLKVAVNPPASFLEVFQKDSRGLIRAVRRSLPDDSAIELVLVIDQFEELFTLVQDECERIRFLGLLVSAALEETSRIRIIITIRADFIDRPLAYMDFGEILRQRMEVVLPLTSDEMESAILSPADRVGLHLETGLVPIMLHDLADQPGALPLMQYALTELFEKREANRLTKSAYQKIGGVLGALGRRAEEVFTSLSPECQAIAKQIFLRLVTLGEGTEDTRRRVLIAEFETLRLGDLLGVRDYSSCFTATLNAFGGARLLSFDRDPGTRAPTVEVAHEAILRAWPRLREWLNENRVLIRMQRQLASLAAEWTEAQHDESFLLTGTKLAQYEGWLKNPSIALTEQESAFLKASHQARIEREAEEVARQQRELETARKLADTERLSAQRVRGRNRVITVIGMAALFLAALAGAFGWSAQQQRLVAQSNYLRADSMRLALEAEKILAQPDGNIETAALLSLRALQRGYLPEADATLLRAAPNLYTTRIYKKHTGNVQSVAFSPDGKYLLTGSADHTAILWEAASGAAIHTYRGHMDSINTVAFSPDGQSILTGSQDRTARVWNVATGDELRSFEMPNPIASVAFSSDGDNLLVFDINGHVKIWNIPTDTLADHDFSNPNAWAILDAKFSPDGKYILAGSFDKTAVLWDVAKGTRVHTFLHKEAVSSVAFSRDGKYILTGSGDFTAYLWEVATGKEIRTFRTGQSAPKAVFSPDGKSILTGGDDNQAILWDLASGSKLHTFSGHTEMITSVAFSPDGTYILTGSGDDTARLWEVSLRPQVAAESGIRSFQDMAAVGSATFSPDDTLILARNKKLELKIWDVISGQVVRTFRGPRDRVYRTVFSPDGRYVLAGSYDGTIKMWEAATGKLVHNLISRAPGVTDVTFSPDGEYILSGEEAFEEEDGAPFTANALLWKSSTGAYTRRFRLENATGGIWTVAFSPDGSYVATGGSARNYAAILWDVNTTKEILSFPGHTAGINQVTFSSDGKTLLTGSDDGTAKLWDVATGSEIRTLRGHTNSVMGVAFSPDGKYVLTGSWDRTAKLWDAVTGVEKRIFVVGGNIISVAFSHDGKWILLAEGNSVEMIALDYETTLDWACARLQRDFTAHERLKYGITDSQPTCPTS